MKRIPFKRNKIFIILLSLLGLSICIAAFFPHVRHIIIEMISFIAQRKISMYEHWYKAIFSYAMGGIFFILLLNYCILTTSGKELVHKVKKEIKDCLSEIDFHDFLKPVLIMFGIYLLGTLTIIRANFLYFDDIGRSAAGYRTWYGTSRYVTDFLSLFIHPEINLTDISPVTLLLAILILSVSSVLLVYILCDKKINLSGLIASVPLGLSPYFLECLSYKFDAPYMALSIFASIVPFLFIARRKAFIFCSVVFLLVMCMTYQATSGAYLLIAITLCFQNWNCREKKSKEILYFFGITIFSFCIAMLLFKFFLMRDIDVEPYPLIQLLLGMLNNVKNYALIINNDFGIIWKTGIFLVALFFITKSVYTSKQKKIYSLLISILILALTFILSLGTYLILSNLGFYARNLLGFGIFLAIISIYVISNYKKFASVVVIALSWCFLVFSLSYGNALADQERYANFRISILLHDLSNLYPEAGRDKMTIQIKNSIDYTPVVKNIAKHNRAIERLVPKRLDENQCWDYLYFLEHFNFYKYNTAHIPANRKFENFNTMNLSVVLDSYYHTIKSDGYRILVVLKH